MTNNPGTWWQGIAALCRWGIAWLSIGLFTLLAGINLLRAALMERILLVTQCIVLAVWALPNGAAGLNGMAALKTLVLRLRGGPSFFAKRQETQKARPVPFGTGLA